MKDIIDYLQNNCICCPDTNDYRSVCGYPCNATYHWRDEIERMKLADKRWKEILALDNKEEKE